MSIRLVLVDDHVLFRDLFRGFVGGRPDLELVGEAEGSGDALAIVEAARADVVLMDLSLRFGDGIMTTRDLVRRDPRTRILVLSAHDDEHSIARALAAGARGYAFKLQSGPEIIDAIRAVYEGRIYLPPTVNRAAVETLRNAHVRSRQPGVLAPLSVREREVFRLLVQGATNDAIASTLHIAPGTVETHRARIIKRLRVHSLAELIRFAAEHQLLHV